MANLWRTVTGWVKHPLVSLRTLGRGHDTNQAPHVGQRVADDGGYDEQTGAEARRRHRGEAL